MLIWPLEKSSKYSVKTGFRLLCDIRDSADGLPQVCIDERSFWKKLWKIQVPEKIKHFLWRACTNSLATKENLVKRKILLDATCSRCSSVYEDTLHSLWSCSGLKEVWEVDFSWSFGSGVIFSPFKELVKLVFTRPESVPLFATTAWSVWLHRNKIRLSENARPLGQIAGFARDYVCDFRSLKRSSPTIRVAAPKVWSPPVRNEWKINFDGAMFCESEEAGVGVVARNSSGVVVAALTEKIRKPPSVEVLELLAARRAALFFVELGLDRVTFEGDSEQVMKALQWGGWDFASGGHLIGDILCIVNSFVSISFSHVCKQGNTVAHALAQRARHSSPISVWLDSYPMDISSFITADFQL
nr:putative ribonuclease h protein [Quercus suber]